MTVFVSTDKAFAKLPAGPVDTLILPENKDQLVAILTYHVVPGAATSDQLAGQRLSVATVNGANVHIDGRNSVIHVIDSVLLA